MPADDIHDAHLYDQLVEDPDDIEGLVAYARYKASERIWLRGFPTRHDSRLPTDEELAAYIQGYDKYDISRLKTEAVDMLLRFANEIVEDRISRVEQSAISAAIGRDFETSESKSAERQAELVKTITTSRSWWRVTTETAMASVELTY